MEMFKNKNGEKITLGQVLGMLKGRDEDGDAASVMDFGIYDVLSDKNIGDAHFYMVATEAVIEKISFVGPFTMVELDFKDAGLDVLRHVMRAVADFHNYSEEPERILLSTVVSLNPDATYSISFANPLICVRGFKEETEAATTLQLVYATDNVVFAECEVDMDTIQAEIDRETAEMARRFVNDEAVEEEAEVLEVIEEMSYGNEGEMFVPDFAVRTSGEKFRDVAVNNTRVSGQQKANVKVSDTNKNVRIAGGHGVEEVEEEEKW